jgi:hypothetical protein
MKKNKNNKKKKKKGALASSAFYTLKRNKKIIFFLFLFEILAFKVLLRNITYKTLPKWAKNNILQFFSFCIYLRSLRRIRKLLNI